MHIFNTSQFTLAFVLGIKQSNFLNHYLCCTVHKNTYAGVPGGYDERYASLVPTIDDYIWMIKKRVPCSGHKVHSICVVNSGDLHRLKYRPAQNVRDVFFHNKFFMEEDQTVMDCLEEELIHRNIKEYVKDQPPKNTNKR